MININELKIGNLVELFHEDAAATQTDPLLQRALQQTNIRIPRNEQEITSISNGSINGLSAQLFEPIVISPQLLYRFGFTIEEPYITNHVFDLVLSAPNTYDVYFNKILLKKGLSFIHQLQNLYQEVTGIQLTA